MKWINVEDRLPENEGKYLVYVEQFTEAGYDNFDWSIQICDFGRSVVESTRNEKEIIHHLSVESSFKIGNWGEDKTVLYWMPLPTPPEKEEEHKCNK